MRVVTIVSTAVQPVPWTVDKDCVLKGVGLFSSSTNMPTVISSDPMLSITDLQAPAADGAIETVLCALRSGFIPLDIQLSAQQIIFALTDTQGSIQLYLEDAQPTA